MEGTTIFAGIRVVQGRDFSIDLDMQEYVEDNVTSMVIPKERRDNPGAAATKSELSEFRGCAGTLQWCVTQFFLQFAVDVSIIMSSACDLTSRSRTSST